MLQRSDSVISVFIGTFLVGLGRSMEVPPDIGGLPQRPALCIMEETNTLDENGTCVQNVNNSLTEQEGLAFLGQSVYYEGLNSNCYQGNLYGGPGNLYISYSPFNMTCEANLGYNRLCIGMCPGGPGYCFNTTLVSDGEAVTCEDQAEPKQAVITYANSSCGADHAASTISYTYSNDLGSCFDVACVTVRNTSIEVYNGATCADLVAPRTVNRCYNRACPPPPPEGRRARSLAAASHLHHEDPSQVNALAAKCGHLEYHVSLFVDGHMYAVATRRPISNTRSTEEAEQGCPAAIMTEAEFPDPNQPYHKHIYIWSDQEQADYFVGRNADSLPIGTFCASELYQAHQSTDPTNNNKKKNKPLGYDVVAHNCADYMLDLASVLGIKVDARITSFVARRLAQEAGQELVDKIRRSANYWSLLLFHGRSNHHNKQQQQPGSSTLRAAAASSTTAQQADKIVEQDNEELIKLLVETRAAHLI